MGKNWQSQTPDQLLRYNGLDTVASARVWKGICSETHWKSSRVQGLYQMHLELSRIASEMHDAGFLVDQVERQRLDVLLQEAHEERKETFLKAVGIPEMRCNSNDVRALLFKRYANARVSLFNLPDPSDKAQWVDGKIGGTISTEQQSLLLLMIQPEVPEQAVKLIELYWKAQSPAKARSTFVVSELVSQAIGPDGRLRAGWNSCGTESGRWSCNKPNIQNLSEKKDSESDLSGDLPNMRAMYRADPGCVLVHADYSQLELRVRAAVAKDRQLAYALSTGDVYSVDARHIFQIPDGAEIKKSARKAAKIGHLGFAYAASTQTLYKQFLKRDRSMPFTLCERVHKGLKSLYRRTVEFWGEEHARVLECGYSHSRIMERWRVYPRAPPITETANFGIQSTASDIANLALIKLDAALKRYVPSARIITQLHDAFDCHCRKEDAETVRKIMHECMEEPFEIEGEKWTFPVESKVGEKWSDV